LTIARRKDTMAAAINILTSKSSNCFKMSFQNGVPSSTGSTVQVDEYATTTNQPWNNHAAKQGVSFIVHE
jgi:hypothetical protein